MSHFFDLVRVEQDQWEGMGWVLWIGDVPVRCELDAPKAVEMASRIRRALAAAIEVRMSGRAMEAKP